MSDPIRWWFFLDSAHFSLATRSRMFMRAVLSEEERVGLLVFDEPSAALDPTAEHGRSRSVIVTSMAT